MTEDRKEIKVLGLKQRPIAKALEISESTLSDYLSGVRKTPDEIARGLQCIFHTVRSEQMRCGHFTFDRRGVAVLKKAIREMEKSITRAARPQPPEEEPVEENRCHAT